MQLLGGDCNFICSEKCWKISLLGNCGESDNELRMKQQMLLFKSSGGFDRLKVIQRTDGLRLTLMRAWSETATSRLS